MSTKDLFQNCKPSFQLPSNMIQKIFSGSLLPCIRKILKNPKENPKFFKTP